MSKEKLTPVEWLLNELDQRDMIDKTIYHEKDRTFDSISEQALKMEKEYYSKSKWSCDKCGCHLNVSFSNNSGTFCQECYPYPQYLQQSSSKTTKN